MIDFKNYRRSAMGVVPFEYPVELVWHTLAGSGKQNVVKPMEIDEWENTTPNKGEIYTRNIETKVNKLLAFKMKTAFTETVWEITFDSMGPSLTKVTFSVNTQFRGDKKLARMLLATSPAAEIKGLASNMKHRLKLDDIERARRVDEFNSRRH